MYLSSIVDWLPFFCAALRVFLASQFETMVPTLEGFIPDGKKSFLTQFVSHVNHIVA